MILLQAIVGVLLLGIAVYWPLWRRYQHLLVREAILALRDQFDHKAVALGLATRSDFQVVRDDISVHIDIDPDWFSLPVLLVIMKHPSNPRSRMVFDPVWEPLVDEFRHAFGQLLLNYATKRTASGIIIGLLGALGANVGRISRAQDMRKVDESVTDVARVMLATR